MKIDSMGAPGVGPAPPGLPQRGGRRQQLEMLLLLVATVVLVAILVLRPGPAPLSPPITPGNSRIALDSPSPAPSASPKHFQFSMKTSDGARIGVSVSDASGQLLTARQAVPDEDRRVYADLSGMVAAVPGVKPGDLIVGWVGGICDLTVTVGVDATEVTVAPGPAPACDTLGVGRAVVLTFSGITPTNLTLRYVPGKVLQRESSDESPEGQ